jgi:vanadium chloroperoxidase
VTKQQGVIDTTANPLTRKQQRTRLQAALKDQSRWLPPGLSHFTENQMTSCGTKSRYWVDMCLECVRRDHTTQLGDQLGPVLSARALGLALAALHDIKAAKAGRPLLLTTAVPNTLLTLLSSDEMIDMAAAAACHQVLQLRYPNQGNMLGNAWDNWIDFHQLSTPGNPVELAARKYGREVHLLGQDDAENAVSSYTDNSSPYRHRAPEAEPNQRASGSNWGQSTRLVTTALPSTGAGSFPPPPGRMDARTLTPTTHYLKDFNKVVSKGEINRTPSNPASRTLKEEVIGIAWGYDGPSELGTPPRLYLQVVLSVLDSVQERNPGQLSELEELTITAAVAVAMADAGIDAWFYKYSPNHMMWRPAVGIPNAVAGNGAAIPTWRPLGRPDTNGKGQGLTPNFPAYPSGHATFGSAAFQLLRLFLAEKGVSSFNSDGVDTVRFEFISDEFNGRNKDPRTQMPREVITLEYESLWEAIKDNSISRVFLGVHWEFDGITKRNAANTKDEFGIPDSPTQLGHTGGVWLGGQIANQVASKIGISNATIEASGMR